jgi:GMP synthase-like glutamine amidotransferase
MRVRVLQHVAHEGPAAIEAWAAARGHALSVTRLDRGEPLPDLADFDLLVSMGGPMSVNDEASYPWIAEEKRLIEAAVQSERRVLGVCLGSQLIASALGKRVFAAPEVEIGWYPVRVRRDAGRSRTFEGFEIGATFTPFHWHGETFDLPEGALHLAESDACPNQAFEIEFDGGPARGGALVLALQFHLEATEASVAALAAAEREARARGPAREAEAWRAVEATLGAEPARYAANRPLLDGVLDRLTAPASR